MTRPDEIAALAEVRADLETNITLYSHHRAILLKLVDAVRVTPNDDFLTQASKTLGHLQNGLAALAPVEKAGKSDCVVYGVPLLDFLDALADNAKAGKRQSLNPIIIGNSAKLFAEEIRAATPTPPRGNVEIGAVSGDGSPETIKFDGRWFDRRETVDALTSLLAEARAANWHGADGVLEVIAKRLEAWDTTDIWRSDAAGLVRSYKQSAAHGGGTEVDLINRRNAEYLGTSDGGMESRHASVQRDSDPSFSSKACGRCDQGAGVAPGPSDPAQEPITDLEWLADHQSLELSFDGFGDDDPAWKVHQVTGGRNDREWNLIGSGDTPANALKAARLALNITEQKP